MKILHIEISKCGPECPYFRQYIAANDPYPDVGFRFDENSCSETGTVWALYNHQQVFGLENFPKDCPLRDKED